jgi:hypothetical protein
MDIDLPALQSIENKKELHLNLVQNNKLARIITAQNNV